MKQHPILFSTEDLHGSEIIRTLGFYQPFGSLMLHGKIETRWVRADRKAPFPLGKYLFYTTQEPCKKGQLWQWSGAELMSLIYETLKNEPTKDLNGWAIALGDLVEVRRLLYNTPNTFVKYVGTEFREVKGEQIEYSQRALVFENVQRIELFKFEFGKQGVGILSDEEKKKIRITGDAVCDATAAK